MGAMAASAWLLLAGAAMRPAAALDVGARVSFRGAAMKLRTRLRAASRPGDTVWESGDSEPVAAPFEALLFQGVANRPGLRFQGAVNAGGVWGPWVEAEGERYANGRFWCKIRLSGGRGAVVRLRALYDGRGPAGWVEFFGLSASDLAGEHASPASRGPFHAERLPPAGAAPLPTMAPRSAWGASPAEKPYEPMVPDRITVHHSEAAQPMNRDAAIQELRAIQRFHQHGRGWIDIAYHFLIDGTGQIWEGRPLGVVGAHVRDKNDGNVGICLLGDFHPPKNQRPSAAQLRSLVELTRWLSAAYGIDPGRIKGHRDQESTSCPGDRLYAQLEQVRQATASPTPPTIAVDVVRRSGPPRENRGSPPESALRALLESRAASSRPEAP